MSFRPDTRPPIQDMPPPGGYPEVDIYMRPRVRGPSGLQLWVGTTLVIAYGFYRVGLHNQERSGEKLEERRVRYAMAPVLQAEEDKWYLMREKAILDWEADVMKHVDGWEVQKSPYLSNRWVPRSLGDLDKNSRK